MFAEDAPQLHPLDDSLEQRQGTDVIGAEFEAVGLGVFARDDFAVWGGVVREPSDRGRASVRALRITPRRAGGNRRTSDQGTKGRDGIVKTEKFLQRLFYWSYENCF